MQIKLKINRQVENTNLKCQRSSTLRATNRQNKGKILRSRTFLVRITLVQFFFKTSVFFFFLCNSSGVLARTNSNHAAFNSAIVLCFSPSPHKSKYCHRRFMNNYTLLWRENITKGTVQPFDIELTLYKEGMYVILPAPIVCHQKSCVGFFKLLEWTLF